MGPSHSVFELAGALDGLELGFRALDRKWRIAWVKLKAAALLNLEPKTAVGKELWEVAPALQSRGLSRAPRKESRCAS